MKTKFNQILLLGLVMVIILGCQPEDVYSGKSVENNQQILEEFIMKKMTSKDIENNIILSKMLQEFIIEETLQGRPMEFPEYGFTIDTESFMLIEDRNGRVISYTFEIIQEDEYKIHNLVLKPVENEEFVAYIVEYEITEAEFESLKAGNPLTDKVPVSVVDLPTYQRMYVGGDGADCVEMQIYTIQLCNDANGNVIVNPEGEANGDCYGNYHEQVYLILTINLECLRGDGGVSGTPIQQIDFGPGGSGGASGTPQNPNNPILNNPVNLGNNGGLGFGDNNGNIVTTPVKNFTLTTSTSLFFSTLNSPQNLDLKNWWNVPDNYAASNYIMAYLNANNTTPQNMQDASEFAINLIDSCVNQLYGQEAENFIISQLFQQGLTTSQQSWWNNSNNTET